MITLQNISKTFETTAGKVSALDDVSLTIETGEVFGIIGESGAGKSTLVRCINLLEQPTSGSVVIDGHDVTSLRGRDLRELRADIGMIFQRFSLFEQRTVLDNVIFPATLASTGKRASRAEAPERARKLLALVGLEGKEGSYPSQLSGGQQQRVAIARAVAMNPKILLFDEATSALDPELVGEVLNVIRNLAKEGATMILVTHEMRFAYEVSDKVIFMDKGKIDAMGTPKEIFEDRPTARLREFLSTFTTPIVTSDAKAD